MPYIHFTDEQKLRASSADLTKFLRCQHCTTWPGFSGEQEPRLAAGPIRLTDKRLRRKIQAKKIAMGHKPDDHEDLGISMG